MNSNQAFQEEFYDPNVNVNNFNEEYYDPAAKQNNFQEEYYPSAKPSNGYETYHGFPELKINSDFKLEKEIINFGNAGIYSGELLELGKKIVIRKIVDASSATRKLKAAFEHECNVLWIVRNHSSFIKVEGVAKDPYAIIFRLYPRGTLNYWISSSFPFPTHQKISFLHDICEGVKFLHENGMVCYDLKPALLTVDEYENGQVRVILSDLSSIQVLEIVNYLIIDYVSPSYKPTYAYCAPEALYRIRNRVIPSTVSPGELILGKGHSIDRINLISLDLKMKALLGIFLLSLAKGFYLPGANPKDYTNKTLTVFANSIISSVTEIPYDFYNENFKWPQPSDTEHGIESLASSLSGDHLYATKFKFQFGKNEECVHLNPDSKDNVLEGKKLQFVKQRIREAYMYQWEVDSLPFLSEVTSRKDQTETNITGVFVGFVGPTEEETIYLYNYFKFTIEYSKSTGDSLIVGASVKPFSYKSDGRKDCNVASQLELGDDDVVFDIFYDVEFVESTTKQWIHRWDQYLSTSEPQIHWFNLLNSIVIVLFLTTMVAMILLRYLHRDISRYNSSDVNDDPQEDFGWKMVHGDVFRAPPRYSLLCVFSGTGAQISVIAFITLLFAALGFLSPANRGSLITAMIVSYCLTGGIAGYYSARLFKMFGGENWKNNVMQTAFVIPGIVFLLFLFLNFILWGLNSSSAVPFLTLFGLICLWFMISAPLCFIGAYLGFRAPKIEYPVRTNQIPRQIPEQPYYLKFVPSILLGGILPFGSIFIELFFIMNSIWSHQFYYLFGFLFVIGIVLVVTCAEVTILLCYFHLCTEDYQWWWRSFLTSGSCALYMFVYSVLFNFQRHGSSSFASNALFYGYSIIMSMIFFFSTGFIGFYACLLFVRKIYGSIKVD